MKRAVSCVLLLLFSLAWLFMPFSKAFSAPSQIGIVEDLLLYAAPDKNSAADGMIGPQVVTGVLDSQSAGGRNWYRINTWLGPRWISPSYNFEGPVMPLSSRLQLFDRETLYAAPTRSAATTSQIAPGTYSADAASYVFTADMGLENWEYRAIRIDTPYGKKWVIPQRFLPNITPTDQQVALAKPTLMFAGLSGRDAVGPGSLGYTYSYLPVTGMLAPQTVQAFETYQSSNSSHAWYHIVTWQGPMWINPGIDMPASIEPEAKEYTLERVTAMYRYPFDYATVAGALAPQTVKSFEKAGDWVHIHTAWTGDVWVRIKDILPQTMKDAEGRVQVGVKTDSFPSCEGTCNRLYTEGEVTVLNVPYDKNDVTLTFELYNDQGQSQKIPYIERNVSLGESRPFYFTAPANFNISYAKLRLASVSFQKAEDRSEDLYQTFSRIP